MTNIPNGAIPMSEPTSNIPALDAGSYTARIYQVIDLGTQTSQYKGEEKINRKFAIRFEIPTKKYVFNEESGEQPYSVTWTVNFKITDESSSLKANLNQIIEAVGDVPVQGYNIFSLLGKTCSIKVVKSPDGKYTNIESATPLSEDIDINQDKFKAINDIKALFLEPGQFDTAVYETLGKKTREKITNSPEYKAIVNTPAKSQTMVPNKDIPDIDVEDLENV